MTEKAVVKASELKAGDVVDSVFKTIANIWYGDCKYSGFVKKVSPISLRGTTYNYLEIYTEEGLRGVYTELTSDITTLVLDEESKTKLFLETELCSLNRGSVNQQGSDPELFVVDKDNQVIPAFKFLKEQGKDLIPETKQPIYWDGFQAEFNIAARSCLEQTMTQLFYGLQTLHNKAKAFNPDARLTIQSTMDIMPHFITNEEEKFVRFGCTPSKNAYSMAGSGANGRDVYFRSAGGHIHLELDSNQKKKVEQYVKALDAILGVASVSLFGTYDDPRRRELYGLAGEYRTPNHGLEYRVLSNAWLGDPLVAYIVFELARNIIQMVDRGLFKHWKYKEEDVISCINECNVPLACEIIAANEEVFKMLLRSICYRDKAKANALYAAFMTGVDNLVTKLDDIENNWGMNKSYQTHYLKQIGNFHNNQKEIYKNLLEIHKAL